jgi:diaminopimelate epimerase
MDEIKIIAAYPAGNITAFVTGAEHWSKPQCTRAAITILADKTLNAEQVGFVQKPDAQRPLWRLEMAGGEFCGNAARSFGLYAAREEGRRGRGTIDIEISGASGQLRVGYEFLRGGGTAGGQTRGAASLAVPPPRTRKIITWHDAAFPLYIFDGIHHLMCASLQPEDALFFELKEAAEREAGLADAFGVMFYGSDHIMRPFVYVRAIDVLNHESSCGSGSAAFVCEHFHGMTDGEGGLIIRQPGGIIEASVQKSNGRINAVSIGGEVTLKPHAAPVFCR